MKNRKVIVIGISIIITIVLILYYKNQNWGNNTNRSIKNLKDYILNISSYEATIEVEIYSNKNINRYILKQWYASPDVFKQEVQSPENIKGLTTTYDGVNLKLQNTKFNLVKIYNDYNELSKNILSLNSFIENCKDTEVICYETEEEMAMEILNVDRYTKYQRLTINKMTSMPVKMQIMDENKKTLVYILYNEITINKTTKEDII